MFLSFTFLLPWRLRETLSQKRCCPGSASSLWPRATLINPVEKTRRESKINMLLNLAPVDDRKVTFPTFRSEGKHWPKAPPPPYCAQSKFALRRGKNHDEKLKRSFSTRGFSAENSFFSFSYGIDLVQRQRSPPWAPSPLQMKLFESRG